MSVAEKTPANVVQRSPASVAPPTPANDMDKSPVGIAFMWDALGPQHVDQVNAATDVFKSVHAVQILPKSRNYAWSWEPEAKFERHRVMKNASGLKHVIVPFWFLNFRLRKGVKAFFLCNYEKPYTFFSALLLRATGAKVFIVQDSKFDDYSRKLPLEWLKSLLYAPYSGALVAGARTRDYLRFLGMKAPIHIGYDTADVSRLQSYKTPEAPAFKDRPFLFVGRLIPKKNVAMLLEAYAGYITRCTGTPRGLTIVGSGPEEERIRARAVALGVHDRITWIAWGDQPTVVKTMSESFYLMVPSLAEQFGNVVGEACSVGLPSLVSTNVGARDRLVDEFVTGFSIPATNTHSWTQAMLDVDQNETLWRRLSAGAAEIASNFDVSWFRDGVRRLVANEADTAETVVDLRKERH
jgi:glycosyltransferase involved in cell wall biosynthesis